MSTIYLVHGFNVKDDGRATTGSLRKYLEESGHTVRELRYGWMGRVRVRLCNASVARVLANLADPGSYIVAHSNGAAIAYLAAEYAIASTFKGVFLINPALDSDLEIPNVDKVHVFYSESDKWTSISKWIPWSKWGDQGKKGFTGDAEKEKYRQTELDSTFGHEMEHSGIFKSKRGRKFLTDTINWEITNE